MPIVRTCTFSSTSCSASSAPVSAVPAIERLRSRCAWYELAISRERSMSLNMPSSRFVNDEPHSCLSLEMRLFSASIDTLLPSSRRLARSFLKNASNTSLPFTNRNSATAFSSIMSRSSSVTPLDVRSFSSMYFAISCAGLFWRMFTNDSNPSLSVCTKCSLLAKHSRITRSMRSLSARRRGTISSSFSASLTISAPIPFTCAENAPLSAAVDTTRANSAYIRDRSASALLFIRSSKPFIRSWFRCAEIRCSSTVDTSCRFVVWSRYRLIRSDSSFSRALTCCKYGAMLLRHASMRAAPSAW
eukprot:comp21650_c0_seq1/m.47923 comp21650_c0_seq1/g.47923  ORF comp21650_c0_seq1/g.47923 comp21650_c0_seq1/m.47923 type:complete len:302 (+) comp21650_c0_seq1:715-1620(+)